MRYLILLTEKSKFSLTLSKALFARWKRVRKGLNLMLCTYSVISIGLFYLVLNLGQGYSEVLSLHIHSLYKAFLHFTHIIPELYIGSSVHVKISSRRIREI